MELFIQIRDGRPYEHPILGENFREAFPHIDCENLPSEFAHFERVPQPQVSTYQIIEGVTYEWVDGIVKDVWHVREMTTEEKLAKQNDVKQEWAALGFTSWVFDEAICNFLPPTPYPDDGKPYRWDESSLSWVESASPEVSQ